MKSLVKIFTKEILENVYKKCSKQPVLCYCDDCYNMEKKETSSDSDSESDEFFSKSSSVQVGRRKTFKELFQEQEKEKTHKSKKIEFTEMSSEDEFFDKLEPIAYSVKEKPPTVIQKELIASPENPTTVLQETLVKNLANEINLTKSGNLLQENPQNFVEFDQKNNLKTIPGASINFIPTKKPKKKVLVGISRQSERLSSIKRPNYDQMLNGDKNVMMQCEKCHCFLFRDEPINFCCDGTGNNLSFPECPKEFMEEILTFVKETGDFKILSINSRLLNSQFSMAATAVQH
jgi:hypothetical protein